MLLRVVNGADCQRGGSAPANEFTATTARSLPPETGEGRARLPPSFVSSEVGRVRFGISGAVVGYVLLTIGRSPLLKSRNTELLEEIRTPYPATFRPAA